MMKPASVFVIAEPFCVGVRLSTRERWADSAVFGYLRAPCETAARALITGDRRERWLEAVDRARREGLPLPDRAGVHWLLGEPEGRPDFFTPYHTERRAILDRAVRDGLDRAGTLLLDNVERRFYALPSGHVVSMEARFGRSDFVDHALLYELARSLGVPTGDFTPSTCGKYAIADRYVDQRSSPPTVYDDDRPFGAVFAGAEPASLRALRAGIESPLVRAIFCRPQFARAADGRAYFVDPHALGGNGPQWDPVLAAIDRALAT